MSNASNRNIQVVPAEGMDGVLCHRLGTNINSYGKDIKLTFVSI